MTVRLILAVAGLAAASSGCSTLVPLADSLIPKAAEAADGMRNGAEYTLCNAITMGAWRREYGDNPRKAAGWALLCNPPTALIPQLPAQPQAIPQSMLAPGAGHAADI